MKILSYIPKSLRHLILYGIIGCCSSSLDFILYTLLVHYGVFYVIANSISVVAGIVTSFLLNRQHNFKVKDNTGRRFAIFLTVGLCGMLLSNLMLSICVEQFELNKIVSKLLSIALVVFMQFIINQYITFKPTKNE